MIKNIKCYFPSSRGKWIKYILTSLPVIFSAMVFAFNSFIDNFMVVNIEGGNQALSYANTWTSLVTGIIAATTVIGSSLLGQYLGSKDNEKIRQVLRARMLFAICIALIFFLPAIINPKMMIRIISGFDNKLDIEILNRSTLYTRWISISWILSAWGYTLANVLRESKHGMASLISSLTSLVINILFNSIFVFIMKKDIEFLAYSTIISLIIPLLFMVFYIWFKDKRLIINPIKLFLVSPIIWKQFFIRTSSFIFLAISSVTVSIRFVFWNYGYPTGSIGSKEEYKLSAATILGISGMFFNIFWTTFEAINANITIFVGNELGNNNILKAKVNSKELQGFHFIVAIIMGLLLFSLSFAIEKMIFLTEGYKKNFPPNTNPIIIEEGQREFLQMIKWTIWPLSWNIPIWVWYLTRNRIISSGGLTNTTSFVEAIFGIVQTGWIILINFVIIQHWKIEFAWAYSVFFLSDLIKIPVFEILYNKIKWERNLTNEGEKIKEFKN